VSGPVCIMLVAAEASGDVLGAQLARALKRRLGEGSVRFVGVGGVQMAAEGVASPFDTNQLSVLGLFEGLMAYPRVRARVKDTLALAERERPDIVVLIDSWGFTLRVAQGLKAWDPSLPIVKYVAPQVWASRPKRARTLAATVDHLLSIHAFDAPYFEREGLKTTFVGAAALARDTSRADAERFRRSIGAGPDDPILLVLPGSRPAEIARMTPPFEAAVALLVAERPDLRVVMPAAASVAQALKAKVAGWAHPVQLIEDEALKYDAMKAATVALACSGTVTTELAMAGCPMVVAYRIGPVTYALLKRLVRTPYITLFNIAAGRAVAPELIQHDCNGPALAKALAERLDDPDLRARQIEAQNAALDVMGRGGGDPSEKAAQVIANMLSARAARS
jgi:lipid-A-disaccharide synthase